MIFSENRFPLFGIMLLARRLRSRCAVVDLVQAAEQEDQQQDRERNAQQPEKSVSHHALPWVCSVFCHHNSGAMRGFRARVPVNCSGAVEPENLRNVMAAGALAHWAGAQWRE
jgi:hypothetical protein